MRTTGYVAKYSVQVLQRPNVVQPAKDLSKGDIKIEVATHAIRCRLADMVPMLIVIGSGRPIAGPCNHSCIIGDGMLQHLIPTFDIQYLQ